MLVSVAPAPPQYRPAMRWKYLPPPTLSPKVLRMLIRTVLFCLLPLVAPAQDAVPPIRIQLENASFEGEPADATMPAGWHKCDENSTPDILPGFWGVLQEPFDGDTFVGLIVRQDGSKESMAQRLPTPMEPKECYRFSVELAQSKKYVNYNTPIKLRIWGGPTKCDRAQLISETPLIDHREWRNYVFDIIPESRINYLIIEAYTDAPGAVMGNVLLDHLSIIVRCPRA